MDLIDREQLMNYIRSRKINIGKMAHDVIMKQPSIQPQEPFDNILTLTERVVTQVTEDMDNFIFTTIKPWCEEKEQRQISKRDLEQALTRYFNKGRWKRIGYDIYECSICGQDVMTGDICAYRYCHCCGAKMESEMRDYETDD